MFVCNQQVFQTQYSLIHLSEYGSYQYQLLYYLFGFLQQSYAYARHFALTYPVVDNRYIKSINFLAYANC